MVRNFSTPFTAFLIVFDTLSAIFAIRCAEWLRETLPIGQEAPSNTFDTPWWMYVVIPIFWIIVLNNSGAYSPLRTYRIFLEILNLNRAIIIAALLYMGIFYLLFRDYSRFQTFYLILLLGTTTIGYRVLVRVYYRLRGGRTYDSRRILVVGTSELATLIARQIRSYAWTGLYCVGLVDDTNKAQIGDVIDGFPVVGTLDNLDNIVDDLAIHEIILAIRRPAFQDLYDLIERMYQRRIHVRLAPDIQDLAYLSARVEDINGIPLISLRDAILSPAERISKRIIDFMVSTLGLVIGLPVMAIIALAIRLESKGSPFFIQERMGEGMQKFRMIKFRTMVQNAEALQADVNQYDEKGNLIHKKPDDPRITKVGHFLRRTSLDELPQLINIWKGDMSIVGPRPEMPWMVEKYESWQLKRFEVPQGLTGWWQINGRAETPMHLATEDDLYYITNYSIMLDLLIMLRTPFVVFNGRGAF